MAEHTSEHQSDALDAFQQAFRAMRLSFEELAVQDRSGDRNPDSAPVTVGQAARHVADWDRYETAALSRMAGGEWYSRNEAEGVMNARWLLDALYIDADEALADLDAAHEARRAMLGELSDEEWEQFGRASATGGREHYQGHADEPCEFPIDRDESMRLLTDARDALLARLQTEVGHGGDAEAEPGGISLGAAIAHIARWDEGAAETLRARVSDPATPDPFAPRYREWNERWLKEDAEAKPAEALERLERVSAELVDELRRADDERWHRDGPRYALGTALHYRSHAEEPLAIPLPER